MSETVQSQSKRRRFTVDSLFTDTTPRANGVTDLPNAKEIQLARIVADPNQPRHSFDEERLEELAESIRREGVLQPIAVRYDRATEGYIVLHGERRWRAAQRAGLETIPALVRDVPEDRRLLQQLMENVVREDLNAVDRASALRALKAQMDDAPWERVAEAVGIRRSRLFQLLGTEKLPEPVQEDLRSGRLSEKQSRVLQGLPGGAQEALAQMIVDDDLPADDAQRLARVVRDDGGFEALGRTEAHQRLRSLRGQEPGEAPPSRAPQPRARRGAPLRTLLGDEGLTALDEADPIAPDELQERIALLAEGLGRLPQGGKVPVKKLRALRSLIDSVLG